MTRRYFFPLLSVLVLMNVTPTFSQGAISGFSSSSAARQSKVEQKFKALPSPGEARRQHRIFTAEPHLAGSIRNNELARCIAAEWQKQGLEDVVICRRLADEVFLTEVALLALLFWPLHKTMEVP